MEAIAAGFASSLPAFMTYHEIARSRLDAFFDPKCGTLLRKDVFHTLGPPALIRMQCGTRGTHLFKLTRVQEKTLNMTVSIENDSKTRVPCVPHGNPGLQLQLVGNLRRQPSGHVGRCPACAEVGQDKGGNHLVIWPDGKFACVCHPGYQGREHRKRIFFLIGNKQQKRSFNVAVQPSLL